MASAAPPPAPKRRSPLLLIGGVILLAGTGAGATVFLMTSGLVGGKPGDVAAPAGPQLVPKGMRADAETPAETAPAPGAPKYESTYFQMEREFTSNLKDSAHLIQVGLAVATNYDQRVIDNLKTHEMAVRSAVLLTLGETDGEQVFTAAGKKDLQQRLARAINATLKEKEGFGGVGNVYFTNFIVQ
ncbi:flagellar basal body protein FliL [Sphingomonas changnyeongensis]|uniref:Flagellar protein FliL n=1 Tax=Sphingomonas changnyeongensis TaxID=2698679 RepID=A0A7Z2NUQ1_9SPHN|nr:flagellar basal body-associated FliL family protein [Sphingomonas changnyeongensis]QHL90173.1 flagellar basal body protein FliL [Sphingomonas changnyeongensis]